MEANQNWVEYGAGKAHTKMKLKVEEFNSKFGMVSYYTSSANFKLETLLDRLYSAFTGEDKINKVKVVVHHRDPDAKDDWDNDVFPYWKEVLPVMLCSRFEVEFYEMPCVRTNTI